MNFMINALQKYHLPGICLPLNLGHDYSHVLSFSLREIPRAKLQKHQCQPECHSKRHSALIRELLDSAGGRRQVGQKGALIEGWQLSIYELVGTVFERSLRQLPGRKRGIFWHVRWWLLALELTLFGGLQICLQELRSSETQCGCILRSGEMPLDFWGHQEHGLKNCLSGGQKEKPWGPQRP